MNPHIPVPNFVGAQRRQFFLCFEGIQVKGAADDISRWSSQFAAEALTV